MTFRRLLPAAVMTAALILALALPAAALHPRYHTHAEVRSELKAVAAAHPAITVLDTLGYSTTDGRAIWGLKISDNAAVDEDEPVVLFNGVHHAEEIMGCEAIMWMIDELTTNYGVVDSVTQWVDDIEMWFIPMLNPDGHWVVESGIDTTWRKNIRDNNGNGVFDVDVDGVDPNFNYDWSWADGGAGEWESPYYRGTAPFSENESQIIRDICLATKPIFSLNYHSPAVSAGDVIYYPWYWPNVGFCPDYDVISSSANALAAKTLKLDDTPYYAVYGYSSAGKCRNWQYGAEGIIGLTMEIMSQMCIPPGDDVDLYCERVSRGSYYLLDRVYGPGLTGHVIDGVTGEPLVAEVTVVENDAPEIEPRYTDAQYGRYWRMLVEGTYTVEFSCDGYESHTWNDVVVGPDGLTPLDCILWPSGTSADEIETGARIMGASPNPFRGETAVSFAAPGGLVAAVEIYTAGGRLVDRLEASPDADGRGTVVWRGTDSTGAEVVSGVYFARLVTPAGRDQVKVVHLK